MVIKSLVDHQPITITNCDAEPIHIPGSIQPHGFLLGTKGQDYTIVYCSENCTTFLGMEVRDVLGSRLFTLFGSENAASLGSYYEAIDRVPPRPFVFTYKGTAFNTIAHQTNDCLVLEFEPFINELAELPDLYIQTKRFAYHTERADNLKTLCQEIAAEIRLITGYDRVMIYRFDEAYNGEVFAESKTEGIEPFLGLHYPHTDIPTQARELYLRNLIRMLVDVNYTPVPIYALAEQDSTPATLDLSLSSLRSFSPIHARYLQNMGVAASFSISLIHDKKLWGLVACHHYTAKHLPYYTRLAAHLQGLFLSTQIDVRQVADEFEIVKHTDEKLKALQTLIIEPETSFTQKETLVKLKDLVNADGFIMFYKEKIYKEGLLPNEKHIDALLQWLANKRPHQSFHTAKLVSQFPEANDFQDTISGLFYCILGTNTTNCLIWTLQEVKKTIKWAGDPNKAVVGNPETRELTPRKSFALWSESVKLQSRDWRKAETDAATLICSTIQSRLHLQELKHEEQRYLALNENLQKANDELANMNWISTHDLKEPLRKIQIYASVILEKEGDIIPQSVKTTVGRMRASAAKMQTLIEDLLSYSKVMNSTDRFDTVDLDVVIQDVLAELKDTIDENGAVIMVTPMPVVKGVSFQIRQLFINLVGNAMKFTKPDQSPIIKISAAKVAKQDSGEPVKTYHCITVADNGIGFDIAFKESIFKVFHRLHSSSQYKGSGIGLAICKKIAEANGGFIDAESTEGEGAAFKIYFPVV